MAGTITTHTGAVTLTDAPDVSQLKAINAATSGPITLQVTNGALSGTAADLVLAFNGTVTQHTGTVTITDAPDVAELKAINAATDGAITLQVTNGALNGSASDLAAAFAGTVTKHNAAVTLTTAHTLAQLKAINDISKDLSLVKPMNRLLCGDVGFGKTEVALRAVFVCCYNNKKTIVVAPTKILSKQLFDEFSLRLTSFGFKVTSSLSAFLSEKKDVLVSTHKVLNSNEALRSCSFFIVDEEHRFGVNQKEKIVSA